MAPSGSAWGGPLKQRHTFGSEKLTISTNLPLNTQRETWLGLGKILTLGGSEVPLLKPGHLLEGSRAESRGCEIIHPHYFCSRLPAAIDTLMVQALPSFPGIPGGKKPPANAGDVGSIPGLGRSPGEGDGNHSSILAWRIPWTEEPGGGYNPWGPKESDTTEAT